MSRIVFLDSARDVEEAEERLFALADQLGLLGHTCTLVAWSQELADEWTQRGLGDAVVLEAPTAYDRRRDLAALLRGRRLVPNAEAVVVFSVALLPAIPVLRTMPRFRRTAFALDLHERLPRVNLARTVHTVLAESAGHNATVLSPPEQQDDQRRYAESYLAALTRGRTRPTGRAWSEALPAGPPQYTVLHVVDADSRATAETLAAHPQPGQTVRLVELDHGSGRLVRDLRRAVQEHQPDVVHTHTLQADLAALLQPRHRRARVTTVHPTQSRSLGHVVGPLARGFDRVVVGDLDGLEWTHSMRYPPVKVMAIPSSYDAEQTAAAYESVYLIAIRRRLLFSRPAAPTRSS